MAAEVGEPVLFEWRPGIWMLGEEFGPPERRRLQLTVHTFSGLQRARAWCARQEPVITPTVDLGGQRFAPRACDLLLALLQHDAAMTVGQLKHIGGTSTAYARQTARRWAEAGLISMQDGIDASLDHAHIALTDAGMRLALQLEEE